MSLSFDNLAHKIGIGKSLVCTSGSINRKQSAIINSIVGFICLVIPIFIQFISRRYFLEYLNVEYLGISGTFGSILNTLSLSELGIQTAVVYCLYKPLAEQNYKQINDLMNVLRIIYKWIGGLFVLFPFLFYPFLGSVLKGTVLDHIVIISFFIVSFTSACSYFLAYKRCLIFADQKDYVSKVIDLCCNLLFAIIQIISLVLFQSFLVFVFIGLLNVVVSNLIIHILCKRMYPFLHSSRFSKDTFKEVWSYTKNIILLRIAAYVYTSTDNIVISSIVGTTWVGFLGNYSILTSKLTSIANGMLIPIGPIIGNLLLEKDDKKNEKILRVYTIVRLFIASVLLIPLFVVFEDLISWWIGDKYVLPKIIKYLLLADFFINIYYTACCDFIGAAGLFNKDRNIGLAGAMINIGLSIFLVYKLGVEGVLIGTVVSQLFFWMSRSMILFKYCIKLGKRAFFLYWIRVVFHVAVLCCILYISSYLYSIIYVSDLFYHIILGSVSTILLTAIIYLVVFYYSLELQYLKCNLIKK